MSNEDELDDGLRRLFADDRLAIRPKPDAHRLIVAGAKRARKRRDIALVGGGSLTAVLVIVGGMLLASPGFDNDQQVAAPHLTPSSETSEVESSPATPTPEVKPRETSPVTESSDATQKTRSNKTTPKTTSRSATTSTVPESLDTPLATSETLGPDGYGKLELGMTFEQVRETGMLADADAPPPEGCTSYQLEEGRQFVYDITVSEQYGLSIITASEAKTPEKIGVGSSQEEVESAYEDRDYVKDERGYLVPTGTGHRYRLVIAEGSTVEAFRLVRETHDCGTN